MLAASDDLMLDVTLSEKQIWQLLCALPMEMTDEERRIEGVLRTALCDYYFNRGSLDG